MNYTLSKKLVSKLIAEEDKTNTKIFFNEDYEDTIINIIYQKNGFFNSLKELSTIEDWQKEIPLEIKYMIVSSKAYLS